jgi:hypothetical protein
VLSAAEQRELLAPGDGGDSGVEEAVAALVRHPVLLQHADALCGPRHSLDSPIQELVGGDESSAPNDVGGFVAGDPRRVGYDSHLQWRVCRGLRFFWAAGRGSPAVVGVISCSHQSATAAPACWPEWSLSDHATEGSSSCSPPPPGVCRRLELSDGDLLVCAATLLVAVVPHSGAAIDAPRPHCKLLHGLIRSSGAAAAATAAVIDPPAPAWFERLNAAQREIVGPRLGLKPRPPPCNATPWPIPQGADPIEYWEFDLRGFVILRGVMDRAWLSAANAALDKFGHNPEVPHVRSYSGSGIAVEMFSDKSLEDPSVSPLLRGNGGARPRLRGLYELPPPYCDPFIEMSANPAVMSRLRWMLGDGFSESMEPHAHVSRQGDAGQSLHAPIGGPATLLRPADGLPWHHSVNVQYVLRDSDRDSGGLCIIPGSHRARFPLPLPPPVNLEMSAVEAAPCKAGDVILFLGDGVCHGTKAWAAEQERRVVIFNYAPQETSHARRNEAAAAKARM